MAGVSNDAVTARWARSEGVHVDEERWLEEARGRVDDGQFERLLTLPRSARRLALARLEQVVSWQSAREESRTVDAERRAEAAGVHLTGFYRMAEAWAETRSLDALGVAAGASTSRTSKLASEVRTVVEAEMMEALRREPDARIEALIDSARRLDLARMPGRTTLYTWAKALRAAYGRKVFGSPMMTILPVEADVDDSLQHEIALVMDRGTGLLLGAAVATGTVAMEAYGMAAADAGARIAGMRLKGVEPTTGRIDLHVVEFIEPGHAVEIMTAVKDREPDFTPIDVGAAWRRVVDRAGDRLGFLRLDRGPLPWRIEGGGRRTSLANTLLEEVPAGRERDWPRMTIEQLRWVLGRSVDAHNRGVLGGPAGGRESAAAHAVRNRVADVVTRMRRERP